MVSTRCKPEEEIRGHEFNSRHLHQKPPVETQETNRRKTTKDSCGGLFALQRGVGKWISITRSII